MSTLTQRRWAVLLSLLVAVFSALAPGLSYALSAPPGMAQLGMEICTSSGPGVISNDDSHALLDASGAPSSSTHSHCPFCLRLPVGPYIAPTPVTWHFQIPLGPQLAPVREIEFVDFQQRFPRFSPRAPPLA